MVFYIAIILYIAIVDDLAPQVNLISSIEMTPLIPTQHPLFKDLMVSIKVLEKLVVEPKTLGWENSRESFENAFENLGVVSTPLKCFQRIFGKMELDMGAKCVGGFIKLALCISVRQTN
jgi:hypothetical protein